MVSDREHFLKKILGISLTAVCLRDLSYLKLRIPHVAQNVTDQIVLEYSLSLRVEFSASNKLNKSAFLKLSVIMSDLSLFKTKSTLRFVIFFVKSKDLTVFQNKLGLQLLRDLLSLF